MGADEHGRHPSPAKDIPVQETSAARWNSPRTSVSRRTRRGIIRASPWSGGAWELTGGRTRYAGCTATTSSWRRRRTQCTLTSAPARRDSLASVRRSSCRRRDRAAIWRRLKLAETWHQALPCLTGARKSAISSARASSEGSALNWFPPAPEHIHSEARSATVVSPMGRRYRIERSATQAYIVDRVAYVNSVAEAAQQAGAEFMFLMRRVTDIRISDSHSEIATQAGDVYQCRIVIISVGIRHTSAQNGRPEGQRRERVSRRMPGRSGRGRP